MSNDGQDKINWATNLVQPFKKSRPKRHNLNNKIF